MKVAVLIARILLGLIFVTFGLNGFLHFLPMPLPSGPAGQFLTVVSETHYMVLVFLIQLVGGILLLANWYVPMALTLLGPVLANILLFHITMAPSGLPLPLIVTVLWFTVFYSVRQAFAGLFRARATS